MLNKFLRLFCSPLLLEVLDEYYENSCNFKIKQDFYGKKQFGSITYSIRNNKNLSTIEVTQYSQLSYKSYSGSEWLSSYELWYLFRELRKLYSNNNIVHEWKHYERNKKIKSKIEFENKFRSR